MTTLADLINDLVIANRILANEGVVDAFGHVSVRHPHHPDRYILSVSRSPELVEPGDIREFALDGTMLGDGGGQPYLERHIHGAIYEAEPEISAVIHSHAIDVLPFSVSSVPLRPVLMLASHGGAEIPVWDIADRFGDTTILVTDMAKGRDLAGRFAGHRVVLMRGHGFTAAGRSLMEVVRIAIYTPINARVLLQALSLAGDVKFLSEGEIRAREALGPGGTNVGIRRSWEYWARRAKCDHLLTD